MWKEFRQFIASRNVMDWAIGIVIGTAFGKIIDSLVNDIITPPIGLLLGHVDFRDLFINLSGHRYASLPQAQAAGAATVNYGVFINAVLNFLLVSFVVYLVVGQLTRISANGKERSPGPSEPMQECPYCVQSIPLRATRCPHCTSQLTTVRVTMGSKSRDMDMGRGMRK